MRAVLLGVVAGLLVSGAALALVILTLPQEPLGRALTPSASPVAASPSGSATSAPSGSPQASGDVPSPSAGASPGPSGSVKVGLRVGDAAPPLAVPQLGGGTMDLAAIDDRPVWVNFTASWCPPCRDELPLMERIQDQVGEELTILVVDVREDPDTVASLATELGLTLPIGLDQDGGAQRAWGAFALPVHYWVDADGRIRHFLFGGPGPDEFIEGVRTVVPDAEIEL